MRQYEYSLETIMRTLGVSTYAAFSDLLFDGLKDKEYGDYKSKASIAVALSRAEGDFTRLPKKLQLAINEFLPSAKVDRGLETTPAVVLCPLETSPELVEACHVRATKDFDLVMEDLAPLLVRWSAHDPFPETDLQLTLEIPDEERRTYAREVILREDIDSPVPMPSGENAGEKLAASAQVVDPYCGLESLQYIAVWGRNLKPWVASVYLKNDRVHYIPWDERSATRWEVYDRKKILARRKPLL